MYIPDKNLVRCTPLSSFSKSVKEQMLRVNSLMMVNAILTVVMVGIGAYGHRYRHHPLTRFLFLTATTLFLPIMHVLYCHHYW
jgi:hypothetical protein